MWNATCKLKTIFAIFSQLLLIFILIFIITSSVGVSSYTAEEVEDFNQLPLEMQQQLVEARYKVRIKDVVNFEGIRDNILMGYGLVVGLDATGDNLRNSSFTQQELEGFLGRLGMNTKGSSIKTRNTAAVTVTATLPPFLHTGSRINVTVSTLGDAKSIAGGVLLATPLLGADGEVYAVAQGNVMIPTKDSSSNTEGGKGKVITTTGYIRGGAIVEREIDFSLNSMKEVRLGLHNPDISTATNIANAINDTVASSATAIDPATVKLTVPKQYSNNVMALLNAIENIKIKTESPAKIIIDSRTGMVAFSENVRVDTVAISHGNLIAQVRGQDPNSTSKVIRKNASLGELVQGLNALGVEPRELIEILQSIKDMGALQAEIIVKN